MEIPAERQSRILQDLDERGLVRVDELSRLYGVSSITIRRDLDFLEQKGFLERTHGGAISTRFQSHEPSYHDKGKKRQAVKKRIAEQVCQLIGKDELLFINSGSTSAFTLQRLALEPRLTIFTNNVGALSGLDLNSESELFVTGGTFRPSTSCLTGEDTLSRLNKVVPTTSIIGVDGLSLKRGLSSHNSHEAAVSRKMIEQTCGRVIVIADSSKIGVLSSHIICSTKEVHTLICDRMIDQSLRLDFESLGINVIVLNEVL